MRRLLVATAFVSALGVARGAQAAPVFEFVATDLLDVNAGEDLWQYEYFVSGWTFQQDQSFSIYFDLTKYSNLQNPASADPNWDSFSIQPDPSLPSAGWYSGYALSSAPSLTNPFVVSFAWLGLPGSAPGSQQFTIDDWTGSVGNSCPGGIVPCGPFLASGTTVPRATGQVPEPSTLLLTSAAAVTLVIRRRRRA
jgi:hypothetical protein